MLKNLYYTFRYPYYLPYPILVEVVNNCVKPYNNPDSCSHCKIEANRLICKNIVAWNLKFHQSSLAAANPEILL
jgi:hypothetical protein